MSDFVQTMKDWRRMCDTYTTDDAAGCCKGCPMDGCGCGAIYENGNADPDIIERKVNQWVAEHPEPVYPTWGQYFRRYYGLEYCKVHEMLLENIPADIAEKLGIEPKEG